MADKNKVLTLKDEGRPEAPPPDPPEPITKKLLRWGLFGFVTVGLFSMVFVCVGSVLWFMTPAPEPIIRGGTLVVLPVEPATQMDDGAADGLTEILVGQLAKVEGLEVKPLEVTRGLQGDKRKANVVGEELAVDYVLQPSYRSAGGQGQLIVVLVDVKRKGAALSQTYKRPASEFFGAVDEAILGVARATNLEEVSGVMVERPVEDASDWIGALNAQWRCAHPVPGDTQKDLLVESLGQLEQIATKQADWATPQLGLLTCWEQLGELKHVKAKEATAKAAAAAQAALAADPSLAKDAEFAAKATALGVQLTP